MGATLALNGLKKHPPRAAGKDESTLDFKHPSRKNVLKVRSHMLYLFKVDNKTPKEHSSCFYWYGNFKVVFKTGKASSEMFYEVLNTFLI